MNRKNILLLVLFIVLSLLGYLGYNIISKTKDKNAITERLQNIPKFELLKLDSTEFTNSNLQSNKETIFIYFNSECHSCQNEAQSISDNLNEFKNVQFIFVSTEPIITIRTFSEHYNLHNQSNITFLYDSSNHFSNRFDAQSIPYILIYNKTKRLIKKHNGQLNAKGIFRLLNK